MERSVIVGSCLCKKVRYRLTGKLRNLCYCHCDSCRRAAGAPFVAWGTIASQGFEVTHGELATINSSKDVERGFCGNCGATITYAHKLRRGEIDVTLVSLDDPSEIEPAAHIWVQDKLAWVQIADELPQYQTVPGVDA